MAVQLILKNSSVADRRPAANQLSNGEIALNYNAAGAFLTCRDANGNIQQVGGVKVSETAPSTPVKQTLWLKPSTGTLSIYSGSNWIAVGSVTSVNGQAGAVTLTSADIGLGNVNNTTDLNKPISTATQNALNTKADLVGGKVPTSQLPSLAVSEYLGAAANQAAMLLLSGERGDWCIRTDLSSTFVLVSDGGSSIGDWQELATPASPVSSVNGYTGAVVLGASDVGAVNLTGDNMTGDLTLGTDKVVLDAGDGSATFEGLLTLEETPTALRIGDGGRGLKVNTYLVSNVNNAGVEFEAVHSLSSQLLFTTRSTQRMLIDQSGHVKIGGTLPSAPAITLEADGNYIGTKSVSVNRTSSSNPCFLGKLSGTETSRIDAGGNASLSGFIRSDRTSSAGTTFDGRLNGTTTFKVLASGSAEFGDDVLLQNDTGVKLTLEKSGASNPGEVSLQCGNFGDATLDYARQLYIKKSGTEQLRISSTGNILIGGTLPSAPAIELKADGAASFSSSVNTAGRFTSDRTSGSDPCFTGRLNGTDTFKVLADGSVSIGGTLPSAPAITLAADGSSDFTGKILTKTVS